MLILLSVCFRYQAVPVCSSYCLCVSGIRMYQFVHLIVCVFQVSGCTNLFILLSVCFKYQGVPVCLSYYLSVSGIRVYQFVYLII